MTARTILSKILSLITPKNLGYAIDTFSKGVQEFGNAMDSVTKELSSDIAKSDRRARKQGTKDRVNVDKLLGKKKPLW